MDKYKAVVVAALLLPVANILLKINLGTIWIAAAGAAGFFVFTTEFINKKDVIRTPVTRLGPAPAREPPTNWPPVDWEFDEDGKPVAKPMAPRRL